MLEKTVTVELPESIYRRVQRAAELTYRSVDEVLVQTIETNLPLLGDDLPAELAEELAVMRLFSDAALYTAVEPTFSPDEQARLAELNQIATARPLAPTEEETHTALLDAYHRSVLRRAQALAILRQRGHELDLPAHSPA